MKLRGGVPTPIPELEDLLAGGRALNACPRTEVWALNKRKPWFHLLFEAARGFFPPSLLQTPKYRQPPPWLDSAFARRNRAALEGYESRLKLLGPRPSFQSSLATLDGLRRQIGCSVATPAVIHEKRYPYLDRDLLAFLYAIPREQLVGPCHALLCAARSPESSQATYWRGSEGVVLPIAGEEYRRPRGQFRRDVSRHSGRFSRNPGRTCTVRNDAKGPPGARSSAAFLDTHARISSMAQRNLRSGTLPGRTSMITGNSLPPARSVANRADRPTG